MEQSSCFIVESVAGRLQYEPACQLQRLLRQSLLRLCRAFEVPAWNKLTAIQEAHFYPRRLMSRQLLERR